jgi:hypothetical protein
MNTLSWKTSRTLAGAALAIATLLTACGDSDPVVADDPLEVALDDLRDATAAFQDLDAAGSAGFVQVTPCWFHGNAGAMGYHLARLDRIGNGAVELLEPEALMYEPQADGSFAFLGVEYIVPIALWEGDGPPSLLDETFARDDESGLFTLHIWSVRENPAGIFAPWNPNVSCAHAEESEDLGAGH